jgi:cytoskeletal protein CcmA (bactofilin family)
MQRLSEKEFLERFPLREPSNEMGGVAPGELSVGQDTCISGIVEGDVFVSGGLHLVVDGIVEGDVHVDAGAVAYVHGTVEGDLIVQGAAFVDGVIEGDIRGARDSAVYAAREGWVTA